MVVWQETFVGGVGQWGLRPPPSCRPEGALLADDLSDRTTRLAANAADDMPQEATLKSSFRSMRSLRRGVATAAAGAMVIALFPAGAAFAESRTTTEICPPDGAPAVVFTDVTTGNVHYTNIQCVGQYEIATGTAPGVYSPRENVRRGQMATFIANMIETATGEELATGAVPFTDTPGTTHAENINKLYTAGVVSGTTATTYSPNDWVRRDAMATFIRQAISYVHDGNARNASEPPAATLEFDDVSPNNTHANNIAALAGQNIVSGTAADTYSPGDNVLRQQMASFIMQGADYLHSIDEWEPGARTPDPTSNQTFTVTDGEAATVVAGGTVTATFGGIDVDNVDLALVECENVTVGTDGIVTFEQDDTVTGQRVADWGTVNFARITEINGVVGNYGTHVNDAIVANDGTVQVTVTADGEGCFVIVAFDDADDDNRLDIDADGLPTEDFAVTGEQAVVAPADIDASPEFALNRFGTNHTVTAQVVNAQGDAQALAGVPVRFTIYRQANPIGEGINNCVWTNPIAVVNATTGADGTATHTYTVADPNPANQPGTDQVSDCIRVAADLDGNGTFESVDDVQKNWSDATPVATTLALTPQVSANPIGSNHTVTATVTDQFGDAATGTVRFEVYREGQAATAAVPDDPNTPEDESAPASATPILSANRAVTNGTATFTYSSQVNADDTIIACVLAQGETNCGAVITTTGAGTQQDPTVLDTAAAPNETDADDAEKFWFRNAVSGQDTTTTSRVVGVDLAANQVVVDDAPNMRFTYQVGDQFTVTCGQAGGTNPGLVTIDGFEQALSVGDTITINPYTTTGVSVITLVDNDGSHPSCTTVTP